jgi:hypothetical protein
MAFWVRSLSKNLQDNDCVLCSYFIFSFLLTYIHCMEEFVLTILNNLTLYIFAVILFPVDMERKIVSMEC